MSAANVSGTILTYDFFFYIAGSSLGCVSYFTHVGRLEPARSRPSANNSYGKRDPPRISDGFIFIYFF